MFDTILASFIRQLGSAKFSVDRAALVVRFAGRPAVRVSLTSEDALAVVKGARDLANTIEALVPSAVAAPVAGAVLTDKDSLTVAPATAENVNQKATQKKAAKKAP